MKRGLLPGGPARARTVVKNFGFDNGMFDPGWLLDMPGALRDARDDTRDWREQYKGHLLHELVCAGGTKWLEAGDQKAIRAKHGSQRLLMPEKNHLCGPILLDAPM